MVLLFRRERPKGVIQTVLNMVMDQYALSLLDGFLDRVELLRDVEAVATLFHHVRHALQMAASAIESLDDIRMRLVGMRCHVLFLFIVSIPLGGMLIYWYHAANARGKAACIVQLSLSLWLFFPCSIGFATVLAT
tara:strand:- start:374 stop:778 length:405 start_codon:yes stop_codon:yes gene_type:complete